MADGRKIITSHKYRVKKAKVAAAESFEIISFWDRRALVKLYLLRDIVRLYDKRIEREKNNVVYDSEEGKEAWRSNLEMFSNNRNIFAAAADVCVAQIRGGQYKVVWSSLKERDLIHAANGRNQEETLKFAYNLLRNLSYRALGAAILEGQRRGELEDLKDEFSVAREVRGLPSQEDINALITNSQKVVSIDGNTNFGKMKPNLK